jgi:fatty-acyl-CoA synthase
MSTSGTTGRLFADEEVNLCASPLFHIASIGAIAPMVLIGGTTVLLPSGGFSSAATLEQWKPNG